MEKKSKAPFIIACVFSGLALLAQVFAMIYGIPALVYLLNPSEGWEGLGAAVLLVLFLILAGVVLVFSIVAIVLSAKNIANKNHKKLSIAFVVCNGVFNLINVLLLVLILIQ